LNAARDQTRSNPATKLNQRPPRQLPVTLQRTRVQISQVTRPPYHWRLRIRGGLPRIAQHLY
jgi:hypothetical protein